MAASVHAAHLLVRGDAKMKHKVATLAGVALLALTAAVPTPSLAHEEGEFLVRIRGLVVMPDESGSLSPIGGSIRVSTSYTPEIDFSYFFTDAIAVELIAAVSKHSVKANNTALGNVDLGNTWVLPPTLLAQYHFFSDTMVSPYVGVGLNYTIFFDESGGPVVDSLSIDDAIGPAFQLGFDLQFPDSNFVFNADAKYIMISPDATAHAGGVKIDSRNFDLNPWVFGFGFGYKF